MTEKPSTESVWHSCSGPAVANTDAVVAKTEAVPAAEQPPRQVRLRSEHDGDDHRYLDAYVDDAGLHIDGHDLGPGTAPVSVDGEYEWFQTIAPADIPRVVALLDGKAGQDILDLLERNWTAPGRSYELERRLRASTIPIKRGVWC